MTEKDKKTLIISAPGEKNRDNITELTRRAKEQIREIAQQLINAKLIPDVIVHSSSLVISRKTAEEYAKAFSELHEDKIKIPLTPERIVSSISGTEAIETLDQKHTTALIVPTDSARDKILDRFGKGQLKNAFAQAAKDKTSMVSVLDTESPSWNQTDNARVIKTFQTTGP